MEEDLDLIPSKEQIVVLSREQYIKRMDKSAYELQKRGGVGKRITPVYRVVSSNTRDILLFFTNKGRVFSKITFSLPEGNRQSNGKHIRNVLELEEGEKVVEILAVKEFDGFLIMATKNGIVKRTALKNFEKIRKSGIIAISFKEDDELIGVRRIVEGEILMATKKGYAIRFPANEIPETGRQSKGVKGISLREDDEVVSFVAGKLNSIFTLTENGYGKRSNIEEYPLQHRGGKGVINLKITPKVGEVVGVLNVEEKDEILVASEENAVRVAVSQFREMGRSTSGVKVIEGKIVDFCKL
jgi:DNA gyrase subunit A